MRGACREWERRAIAILEAEGQRSADTHLILLPVAGGPDVSIYLKDESVHPSGSLKHRLARSLILYGICNGQIHAGTTLVEASSGSTAVSEAYYARLLGLEFWAVLPRSTSCSKVEAIERQGGKCHFVDDPASIYSAAAQLAEGKGGHYLDQFTFAERATDWRGNNNIAESIFRQLERERHPIPSWIVMSAGTGGTSATIGRYLRLRGLPTRLCVPDVEFSAFYEGWVRDDPSATGCRPSRIEGIGRPRVEKSFVPGVVDAMLRLPDAATIAAAHVLSKQLGRRVGGSTGSNFIGAIWAAEQMRQEGISGSIVTLICDSGERYADTYFNEKWLMANDLVIAPHVVHLETALRGGGLATDLLLDQHRLN